MIEKLFNQMMQQENKREAVSRFREAVKEEAARQTAQKLIGDGEILKPLLSSDDAKVRKNTAALLGDLEIGAAAPVLYHAYQKEEQLFVRGTFLKALGKTNPDPYLAELRERYDLLCRKEVPEEEKKHVREELHELQKILRKYETASHHRFTGWNQKLLILLTTNTRYANLTADKVHAYRKGITSLGVQAVVDNLKEIVQIRTFRELLFPIGLGEEITFQDGPDAFGEALSRSKLIPLLESCHKEPVPFYFRIDLMSKISLEERSRYTRRAAAVIEEKSGRKLINAPDDYEYEVRLIFDKEGRIRVFLKMLTIPMERFAYRKESVSASIHPSTAAMLLELARPYLKERARVLDPCCGVGTMLVERNKLLPTREMYAVDIFGEAVDKAILNTERAGMRVNCIRKDYLEFEYRYQFDEIIADMPARGKRSKAEQDAFYEGFFHKSQELLASDGIMILYSNETGFVKKQLRLHPDLKLRREYLIREKDSYWLFIIGRR